MSRANWLCASAIALTLGHVLGCSHPYLYTAPATFTVNNESVTKAIEDVMTYNSMVRMDGKPTVDCAGETHCTIAYTVQQSLGGSSEWEDNEMIRPTRQIWKTLFADPRFQSGTITVSGPATSEGFHSPTQPYYSLTCDRQQAAQIDWKNIDGWGLRQSCEYSPMARGMPGS